MWEETNLLELMKLTQEKKETIYIKSKRLGVFLVLAYEFGVVTLKYVKHDGTLDECVLNSSFLGDGDTYEIVEESIFTEWVGHIIEAYGTHQGEAIELESEEDGWEGLTDEDLQDISE